MNVHFEKSGKGREKKKRMNNINQMFTKRQTESEEYIEMNESQWKIDIYSWSIVDNWTHMQQKAVPVQKFKAVNSG